MRRSCLVGVLVLAACFKEAGTVGEASSGATTGGNDTDGSTTASGPDASSNEGTQSGPDTSSTEDTQGETDGASSCVAPPPTGWDGPVAMRIASDARGLQCDLGWPLDHGVAGIGDPGVEPECGDCSCGPAQGAVCPDTAPFDRHANDPGCVNLPTQMYTSTSMCTGLAGTVGGHVLTSRPTPTPGMCAPAGGGVTDMDPAFAQYAKICGIDDRLEPCEAGLRVPTFEQPGDWAVCIRHDGDLPTCPPGSPYGSGPFVVADEFVDGRECSACTCDSPTGVICSDYTTILYGTDDCGSLVASIVHDDTCTNQSLTFRSYRLQGTASVGDEGTCAPSGGNPAGAVEVTHQSTLCCL